MLEHVSADDVEIGAQAGTWEEAIARSARYLLETGKIEQRYIDAMVDAVKRVGPYIVLTDQVALAHARPECGAVELAVHFTVFPDGIAFGTPFDPIRLIITLAAVDDVSHLDLMAELATVLMNPANIDALVSSATPEEFVERLKGCADAQAAA